MKALLQALRLGGHKIKQLGRAVDPTDAVPWFQAYQSKSITIAPPLDGDIITMFTVIGGYIEVLNVILSLQATTGEGTVLCSIYGREANDRTIITATLIEDTEPVGTQDGSLFVEVPTNALVPDGSVIVVYLNSPVNVQSLNITLNYRLL
jgi:hypothetical protein